LITKLPVPASAGENTLLLTPVPLYTPPGGTPSARGRSGEETQTTEPVCMNTKGSGKTVTRITGEGADVQPLTLCRAE